MTLKRKPKTDAVKRVIDPEAIAVFSSQASNVSAEPVKISKKKPATVKKILSLQTDDIQRLKSASQRALILDAGDMKAVVQDSFIVRVALRALLQADDEAFCQAVEKTRIIKVGKPRN